MKIKFLGASGTVTGSSYLLTSGAGSSILIDLGMFQGAREIDQLNYDALDCSPANLAGVVLTHAHLDHCGRLPILLKGRYNGPIWMTSATADLTELSLLDSAKVAKEDKKKILYDKLLAEETIRLFKREHYGTPFVVGDFTVTMCDAGHILGAATLVITDNHPDSDIKTIVFSGDLGNSPDSLLRETETVAAADAVVMESTYGDRLHPADDPMAIVAREINEVEAIGGTLLIPAFSLHRTQVLMHMIMHLKKNGKVRDETPVFMDSPMGNAATTIYTRYPEDFNSHMKNELTINGPFDFPGLTVIHKQKAHKLIDTVLGAKVIIAGSGMMSGGRIVGHAARYLPIPSTRLLIVGYQGEETLGREILDGAKTVTIDKQVVHIKAAITDTQAMSAHADQGQLMEWLGVIKGVRRVFLTHGDDEPRKVLAGKIKEDLSLASVHLPLMREEVTL